MYDVKSIEMGPWGQNVFKKLKNISFCCCFVYASLEAKPAEDEEVEEGIHYLEGWWFNPWHASVSSGKTPNPKLLLTHLSKCEC